jgi:predicted phage terminase large subunit-like protein
MPVVAYDPGTKDKIARAHKASPYLEGRRQFVPADASWRDAFVEELAVFPGGAHDDQVDAYSQATLRAADRLEAVQPIDPLLVGAFRGMPRHG